MVRVQLVVYGACLGDQAAETDGRGAEGKPRRGEVRLVHSERLGGVGYVSKLRTYESITHKNIDLDRCR